MKKCILFLIMFSFILSLFACSQKIAPLENPQPELFTLFYSGENYSIYKRIDIDEEKFYPLLGFPLESEKGTSCSVGLYHLENYIVFYDDYYYDLQSSTRLKLFNGNELTTMGIDANCREN